MYCISNQRSINHVNTTKLETFSRFRVHFVVTFETFPELIIVSTVAFELIIKFGFGGKKRGYLAFLRIVDIILGSYLSITGFNGFVKRFSISNDDIVSEPVCSFVIITVRSKKLAYSYKANNVSSIHIERMTPWLGSMVILWFFHQRNFRNYIAFVSG